ncbi:MAG: virginiamycin B lyase, partial [Acidimicrobiia bacterium]|nr:virginiamycin B lyase [Acidimicrobiia bacterium]
GHLVYRIATNGNFSTFDNPGMNNQFAIAAGPGGTLWTTEDGGVAKFSPPAS